MYDTHIQPEPGYEKRIVEERQQDIREEIEEEALAEEVQDDDEDND